MRLIASSVRARYLRIHLGKRIEPSTMPSSSEQVPQRVAECRVERGSDRTNLVAARCRIIAVQDAKVVAQQFEHRQPSRGLAV